LHHPCLLQVLLTVANKYNMPALLSRAGPFLQGSMQQLSSSILSQQFAWKWITLADKRGLPDVAKACITSCFSSGQAAAVAYACKKDSILGMSPATCCHLLAALAQHRSAACQPGMVYCSNCNAHRQMHFQSYSSSNAATLRCKVCQKDTTFTR
jgi:hypothetical protein